MISETFNKKVTEFIENNNLYIPTEEENSKSTFSYSIQYYNDAKKGILFTFCVFGKKGFDFSIVADTVEHAFNRAFSVLKAFNFKDNKEVSE